MRDEHADAVERAIKKLAEQTGTPLDALPDAGLSGEWLREYERPAGEALDAQLRETR